MSLLFNYKNLLQFLWKNVGFLCYYIFHTLTNARVVYTKCYVAPKTQIEVRSSSKNGSRLSETARLLKNVRSVFFRKSHTRIDMEVELARKYLIIITANSWTLVY